VALAETYETRWTTPSWLGEARAWIEEQLAAYSREITGPLEQPHLQQWATALRVPATGGVVWFKACLPELAFETRVLELLAAHRPELLPTVLASEPARSWLLLEDAGDRLRELESQPGQVERWAAAVGHYAELQQSAAADADALVAAGATDRRGKRLLEQFGGLLEHDHCLTADEVERLRGLLPALGAYVNQLDELGVPDSIQHDDLHDGNIFVRNGDCRIIDWGDSCVAHPFHSLTLVIAVVEHRLGPEPVAEIRDAYLAPWSVSASSEQLDAAFRLGYVSGTLKWHEVRNLVADPSREPFDDAMPLRLRRLLELCG
jgi:Phosphotransferase enzyme family